MGSGSITVGGVQFAGLRGEKERNTQTAERLIRQAVANGAQIVLTPEVALTGFVGGAAEREMAEPIPGPTTERFGALARELGAYLLVGFSERRDDDIYNAMAVLAPDGTLLGAMRKVHINRFETAGGWRNGSAFPVWNFTTPTGSMAGGIMICYDREVPESARMLMVQGVDVIFNPLACGCPVVDMHRCLLRTRAFENEVYVFMVNHAAPRENGHSFVVDFEGTIRRELGCEEGILLYDVDLDALARHRETGLYGKHHRRPELYLGLTDPDGQLHPSDANLPFQATRKQESRKSKERD